MASYGEQVQSELEDLRVECGYSEDDECPVDTLIEYKNALEDRYALAAAKALAFDAIHAAAQANSDDPVDKRGREVTLSAGDVVSVVWQEVSKL